MKNKFYNKIGKYYLYFKNEIDNKFFILFSLMVLGAAFEIVGISLFMPLLTHDESNKIYLLLGEVFDIFSLTVTNLNIAIFIVCIFLFKFIIINIQNYLVYSVSYLYMHNVKQKIIKLIFVTNYIKFVTYGVDKLNNMITKEIEKASLSIRYILQLFVNVIYMLFYLILALYINVDIVISSLIIGIVVVSAQKTITRLIIHHSKEIVSGNDQTNLVTLQILNNLKYLISTNNFIKMQQKYDQVSEKYSMNGKNISFFNSIPKSIPEPVSYTHLDVYKRQVIMCMTI